MLAIGVLICCISLLFIHRSQVMNLKNKYLKF
jgi:hypothetical protein